jgi:hypothetical protein
MHTISLKTVLGIAIIPKTPFFLIIDRGSKAILTRPLFNVLMPELSAIWRESKET